LAVLWLNNPVLEAKIRVLVAKPGLDGHDRGAKVIARALRDAGMEVIYTGLRQTPEMIVNSALQEDVDVIGISNLSSSLVSICTEVRRLLHAHDADDVLLVAGGTVLDEDRTALRAIGIEGVFGPGTNTSDIAAFIRSHVDAERGDRPFEIDPAAHDTHGQ